MQVRNNVVIVIGIQSQRTPDKSIDQSFKIAQLYWSQNVVTWMIVLVGIWKQWIQTYEEILNYKTRGVYPFVIKRAEIFNLQMFLWW